MPIFRDGKLKPGIYKIQNIVGHTHVDIREDTRELCCRPATVLNSEGKGLWEILPLGPGYTIRRIEPEKPNQFCFLPNDGSHRISVTIFPVAWRVEMVHDEPYRGLEYVRIFWGATNLIWDLHNGSNEDLTPMHCLPNDTDHKWRIWKLTLDSDAGPQPVPEATPVQATRPVQLPPYDGNPGSQNYPLSHQTTETNVDEFGTTVTEVTVTTTNTTSTVTTRKKYRVEGE